MQPKGKRKDAMHVDGILVKWTAELDAPNGPDARWHVQAVAQVSYQLADGIRRLEWFRSGGLGGIDYDGRSSSYTTELQYKQIEDLRHHLTHFGIEFSDVDWSRLAHDARLKVA